MLMANKRYEFEPDYAIPPGATLKEVMESLDMVTVKTDDKDHDFSRDALTLKVEDGWLLADRTTLGADNGLVRLCQASLHNSFWG